MSDLISRQAAIMHFVKASKNYECGMLDLKEITHELWQMPSAQPERKKGKWIQNDNGTWSCDQCHSWIPDEQHYYANWCLFCGADMRGEQDDESRSNSNAQTDTRARGMGATDKSSGIWST